MTKPRTPDSFEDAAMIAAGQLGADRTGDIAGGLSGSAVRKWTDPDQDGRATLHQALKVDVACATLPGGKGLTPFLTAYRRQLQEHTRDVPSPGDLLSEALDIPGAVGRLTDAVVQARAATSSSGTAISPAEGRNIRRAIKEARDELDELQASLDAEGNGQ